MVFGLAPFETYYHRFVDAGGQTWLAWTVCSESMLRLGRQITRRRRKHGEHECNARQGRRLTYSDCSIGRGFTGTDCNKLAVGKMRIEKAR